MFGRREVQPVRVEIDATSVAEAMRSAVGATIAAYDHAVTQMNSALAERDAQIAGLQAELRALRDSQEAFREAGAHLSTRMNSLTGLVNRKVTGGKMSEDDARPLTYPLATPEGSRAW